MHSVHSYSIYGNRVNIFDFSPSVIFNQIDRENRIFFGRALHTTRTVAILSLA
jgi:hypothetical protein